jgi:hypothetical protein
LVDGVVELLGVVVFGVAWEFGVVSVLFGVVVAPLEVEPGVIVPLLVPVVALPVASVEVPVFEDCGTPVELAGTQFEAVLVEDGVVELFVELGDEAVVDPVVLGEVLEVALGEVLELGVELAVEELGVADALVEALADPAVEAVALVAGTMPAGQLFIVEEELGVVALVPVVDVPVCVVGEADAPVCDEVDVDGEVVVVVCVLVVEEVCAAAHVAVAVRTRINVNFFMFSVLVGRVANGAMPIVWSRCAASQKKRAGARPARLVVF